MGIRAMGNGQWGMGNGEWGMGNGEREEGGEKRKKERRDGSPHPGPLPSEWEREEEKTRLAEDGQAVAPDQVVAPD